MTWFEISHYDVDGPCPCPGCEGTVCVINPEGRGCTCFQSAPCGFCTDSEFCCSECDWDSRFEYFAPEIVVKPQKVLPPQSTSLIVGYLKILAENDFIIDSVCFETGNISLLLPGIA